MQRFKQGFPAIIGWSLLVIIAILILIELGWKWALIAVASVLLITLIFYRIPWMGLGPHPVKKTEAREYDAGGNQLTKLTVTEETHTYRTLWDWIGLLTVSAVLALIAFKYTTQQNAQQQFLQDQQAKDASLRAYIDGMSTLMLDENLLTSKPGDAVRDVARARTLVALITVGPERKRQVVRFLYESKLIKGSDPIISLAEANLEDADLTRSALPGINLSGANLSDGPDPDSRGALLMHADLQGAYLEDTDLDGAKLRNANLRDATGITAEKLRRTAASLSGTVMPANEKRHQ